MQADTIKLEGGVSSEFAVRYLGAIIYASEHAPKETQTAIGAIFKRQATYRPRTTYIDVPLRLQDLGVMVDARRCQKPRAPSVVCDDRPMDEHMMKWSNVVFRCDNPLYPYPGFHSSDIPCCFKTPQTMTEPYQRNQNDEFVATTSPSNYIYKNMHATLPTGRKGQILAPVELLPAEFAPRYMRLGVGTDCQTMSSTLTALHKTALGRMTYSHLAGLEHQYRVHIIVLTWFQNQSYTVEHHHEGRCHHEHAVILMRKYRHSDKMWIYEPVVHQTQGYLLSQTDDPWVRHLKTNYASKEFIPNSLLEQIDIQSTVLYKNKKSLLVKAFVGVWHDDQSRVVIPIDRLEEVVFDHYHMPPFTRTDTPSMSWQSFSRLQRYLPGLHHVGATLCRQALVLSGIYSNLTLNVSNVPSPVRTVPRQRTEVLEKMKHVFRPTSEAKQTSLCTPHSFSQLCHTSIMISSNKFIDRAGMIPFII